MSNPQGSGPVNQAYFTAMAARAQAAGSCAEIRLINTDVTTSVNATVSAVTSQISAVQNQMQLLEDDISTLIGHIDTLTASTTSMESVGTVSLTAAAVNDLGSAIAYIKAQGLVLAGLSTTNSATFIAQAIALGKELLKIQNDYSILENKITTLEAQLTQIPAQLENLQATMFDVSLRFPSCSL